MHNSCKHFPTLSLELLKHQIKTCTSVACMSCLELASDSVRSKLVAETQAGTLSRTVYQRGT